MKKIFALLLSVGVLLLVFSGCGSQNAIQSHVMLADTKVALGAAYDDALATALGTPADTQEAVSCHYDGYDTIYTYDGFQLYTYQLQEQKVLYCIEITDSALSTPEGANVGMTAAQIEEIYGAEYEQLPNGISYPLNQNGAKLNFRLKDGAVYCIEYYTE